MKTNPKEHTDIDIQSFLGRTDELLKSLQPDYKLPTKDALIRLLSSLPEKMLHEIKYTFEAKDVYNRFVKYTDFLNACIIQSMFTPQALTFEQAATQAHNLYLHCLDIWHDSVTLFHNGSYPIATFLAIGCIEESAKLTVLSFKILYQPKGKSLAKLDSHKQAKKHKDHLLSHRTKHFLAGMSGLLVNARADRILGQHYIVDFLDLIERGQLESFRQSCLYCDITDKKVILPKDKHTSKTAARYISLAGEILAESFFNQLDSPFMTELSEFESLFLTEK